jgi:hypothetical protein
MDDMKELRTRFKDSHRINGTYVKKSVKKSVFHEI